MSEEEKQAIIYLNKYLKSDLFYEHEHYNKIKIVLNLIDNLQKEIEEYEKQIDLEFVEENYIEKNKVICKDIIRNKIKELEVKYKKYEKEGLYGFADRLDIGTRIDVLKELLGE